MKFLESLIRAAMGARRHIAALRPPRDRAIVWSAICDGGVVVVLEEPVHVDAIRIVVTRAGASRRRLAVSRAGVVDDKFVAFAPLEPAFFAQPGRCVLAVTVRGRTTRQDFVVGPDRYAGRLEGVRDYGLEGWVSPLFAQAGSPPVISLLIDGATVATAPLDRLRRDLAFSGRQGGWNGFRVLLPAAALDGRSHLIAIQAGSTTITYGPWASKPLYNIDSTRPDHFAGWYFDRATENVPATLRIVTDGATRAEVRTLFRPDIKAQFGRDAASFDFRGQAILPGSMLVAGPEGTGVVLGWVGEDLLPRIDAHRSRARNLLMDGQARPTLAERRAIRAHIVDTERGSEAAQISFRSGSAPVSTYVRDLRSTGDDSIPPVCVIVPVYNGLNDVRLCLESLIPQLRSNCVRAIIIDDASPDPEIARYLQLLQARGLSEFTVLSNQLNLGFIGTVNRGLNLLQPGEDALILNADTILPAGLVGRLARHCHAWVGIASVTPMSNNGSIVSFPDLVDPNPLVLGLDAKALDTAFARRAAAPVVIPTGVGFCLYLNRDALDEVGPLSLDWGRGYCEEVDWCLTARDLGWIHLAATDTFVSHQGSVSFGVAERTAIMKTNHARLERLYPEFVPEVYTFLRVDPLETLRIDVLAGMLAERFARLTLQIMHGLGGGTKRYVDDLCALPRAADHEIACLMPPKGGDEGPRLSLVFNRAGVVMTLKPGSLERLLNTLETQGIAIQLHVNSRIGYSSDFLSSLLSGRRPYYVMLHDFQWYCPRVNLTDERHFYCNEPPLAICQLCVSQGVDYDFGDQNALIKTDLEAWLAFNIKMLHGAERLFAPSKDAAERYKRRLGVADVRAVPHPELHRTGVHEIIARRATPTGAVRIAVVGAIGRHKGYEILLQLSARAAHKRIPFLIDVIGYTQDDVRLLQSGNVTITGVYEPGELRSRLVDADPDYVFLSSVWPETYSYVLSEVWNAGYPVVAFDLGAPAERIRNSGGGIVIPFTRDTHQVLDNLISARAQITELGSQLFMPRSHQSLEEYYQEILDH